jgi:hypothetical protein
MNKKEAIKFFNKNIKPSILKNDRIALLEAWGIYIDSLCKDSRITSKQYNNWEYKKGK